ncbi:MAG: hypothetical protein ACJAS1_000348 [Oleiphilaceae bacterium]|jgi:hypothetical protein
MSNGLIGLISYRKQKLDQLFKILIDYKKPDTLPGFGHPFLNQ